MIPTTPLLVLALAVFAPCHQAIVRHVRALIDTLR
jgi:hypothetical protein